MPGMVMVHEHLFYPTGPGVYGNFAESFSRLYLAGGVTSMRTGGNMNGFGELATARATNSGDKGGTVYRCDGTVSGRAGVWDLAQVRTLVDAADARKQVEYWAGEGATSFKAYMNITRDELGAAIQAAHAHGLKVTGHLCSVTYREAADLGIDNLEHGFFCVERLRAEQATGQMRGTRQGSASSPSPPSIRKVPKCKRCSST